MEDKLGKVIPIDDIIDEGKKQGIDEEEVEEVLETLKRKAEIFEPRTGFIQCVRS